MNEKQLMQITRLSQPLTQAQVSVADPTPCLPVTSPGGHPHPMDITGARVGGAWLYCGSIPPWKGGPGVFLPMFCLYLKPLTSPTDKTEPSFWRRGFPFGWNGSPFSPGEMERCDCFLGQLSGTWGHSLTWVGGSPGKEGFCHLQSRFESGLALGSHGQDCPHTAWVGKASDPFQGRQSRPVKHVPSCPGRLADPALLLPTFPSLDEYLLPAAEEGHLGKPPPHQGYTEPQGSF